MYPISPMLAEACKSVEKAIEKCPRGMYSEIKYDGERVQLHKQGNEFKWVFFFTFYFKFYFIFIYIKEINFSQMLIFFSFYRLTDFFQEI